MPRNRAPNTGNQNLAAESGAGGGKCPEPKQDGSNPPPEASPPLESERRRRAGRRGPARQGEGKGMGREGARLSDVLLGSQKALQLHEDLAHRHGVGRTSVSQGGEGGQPSSFGRQPAPSVTTPATTAAASTGPCAGTVAGVLPGPRRAEGRAVRRSA